MGWLADTLGTNTLNQNFNYTPSVAGYNTNNMLNQSMSNINQNAQFQSNAGQQMIEGRSPIIDQWKQDLSQRMGSQVLSQSNAISQQLASRGMGTGGLSSLVNASLQNKGGEQLRMGFGTMQNQAFQQGANLMNQGTAGFGQVGQLSSAVDQRALQQAMFNAEQRNQQQQYSMTSSYNQAAGNRATRGEFAGNMMSMMGSMGPDTLSIG